MKAMIPPALVVLFASILLADGKGDEDRGSASAPYADLFTVPSKITLSDEQKEKLVELRKANEATLTEHDKVLKANPADYDLRTYRDKLVRILGRKRIAILTEEQRKTLGVKLEIPAFVQEKTLADPKVWDLSQLEKSYTIESRSFDPEEQVVAFMVITKRKWNDKERYSDAAKWGGGLYYESKVKCQFYNKNDEPLTRLTGPYVLRVRGRRSAEGGISRVETKLTDKQKEEGLIRFRIKIDLDRLRGTLKDITSAKFECPELKEEL